MKHLLILVLIFSFGIFSIIPNSLAAEHTQICIDKVWIENIKGRIACVTSSTGEKLVERGWGILLEDKTVQSIPLTSWNDGMSKQKIIEFVEMVTNPESSEFVPVEDRIATFDNDGTLWIEKPLYIPFSSPFI